MILSEQKLHKSRARSRMDGWNTSEYAFCNASCLWLLSAGKNIYFQLQQQWSRARINMNIRIELNIQIECNVSQLCYVVCASWFVPIFDPCERKIPFNQQIVETYNVSICSGGLNRSYLINLPPKYLIHGPAPVILSFHGGNRNTSEQLLLDQLSFPEFNDFAITVYPQGVDVGRLRSSQR